MTNLRKKFTKWYYRKGYRMMWVTSHYGNGVHEMIFSCPWWVRPLVEFFFSPSVYYAEEGYQFGQIVERRLEELKGKADAEQRMENP